MERETITGKIIDIRIIESEPVYDLTTEQGNFFANDVLVHNCAEINLRSREFCNLTEAVIRAEDTKDDIARKIRMATILGTFQSTLLNFKYISKRWQNNCEEERLLGVSMTGILDNEILSNNNDETKELLKLLKQEAISVNDEWAKTLGINPSVAITTGKPSGTVSSLVNSSSGIHARFAPYYIRRVRGDAKDPLVQFMQSVGFPWEPDAYDKNSTVVFSFPMKSPDGAIFANEQTAISQLEMWKTVDQNYCEHNQSVTIYVREHEWLEVGSWVYENFDIVTGLSFLPYSDHVYKQAPFEPLTSQEYYDMIDSVPKNVDWSGLADFEDQDLTAGAQTMACSGNSCEIVDLL